MSRLAIPIDASHRLSRFYVHGQPYLHLNHLQFTSIESCYFYAVLCNAGNETMAEEMRCDQRLQRKPGEIRMWCNERGFEPSAASVFASSRIYSDIVKYQFKSADNPFVSAFFDTLVPYLAEEWPSLAV